MDAADLPGFVLRWQVPAVRIELLPVCDLEPADAAWMAAHLCNPRSEMQTELYARQADTPIVVFVTDRPIAWVASHEWHGNPTIEAFTDPEWRRRGLAKIGTLMLAATSHMQRHNAVAVFSGECAAMARSLGFRDVLLYQRTNTGWSLVLRR
jgi:GNAT superfamily N-acetyltransferase